MLPEAAVKGKAITKVALPMTVAAKPTGRPSTASKNAASGSVAAPAGEAMLSVRPAKQQADNSLIFIVFLYLGEGPRDMHYAGYRFHWFLPALFHEHAESTNYTRNGAEVEVGE